MPARGPDEHGSYRPRLRFAGGILLADGLLRLAGRRARRVRLPLSGRRLLGGAEATLGLTLLKRAPIEPEPLYQRVAPIYDALSPIWRDWLYRDPLQAFDAAVADALPPRGDVLDLGCGTGAVLERLLAMEARFGSYVGVDLSAAMLARARAKVNGTGGIRFARLDLRSEPLPDGPFDLVVSAWALEHLPDPEAALARARDRLRWSGRLVIFFELDGNGLRAWVLRGLWRWFGVRLIPEREVKAWPGLVSLRRFEGLGPDVAVAVIAAN